MILKREGGLEVQLTTLQMEQAWYAYQVDAKAAKLNVAAFAILQMDERLAGTDDLDEFVLHYQEGRSILCRFLCIPSSQKFVGTPPGEKDPLVREEMPDNCAGFITIESGYLGKQVVYECIYFAPITPEVEYARRETLLWKLASISDNEALVLHTDAGKVTAERLEKNKFLVYSRVDYPHEVFRSSVGDLLEIWRKAVELEERIAREWQVIQRD